VKSDISRLTFDPKKHYSQVVMQQGRVQLDADWNEQQAILQHQAEIETRDILGCSGVPQREGGFEIKLLPGDRDFLITPGRIYVDGILCELEEETPVEVQSTHGNDSVMVKHWIVDGRVWDKDQWVELLDQNERHICYFQIKDVDDKGKSLTFKTPEENPPFTDAEKKRISSVRRVMTYANQPYYPGRHKLDLELEGHSLALVYLDVWQRHVTAFDDPRISEVALDGLDTTTRLQTVWQVKILTLTPPDDLQNLMSEEAEKARSVDLTVLKNPPHEGQSTGAVQELRRLEDEIIAKLQSYNNGDQFPEWEQLIQPPTGTLNVTTHTPASGYSGYQEHDNQLFRVEIYNHANDPKHYKWARNNASTLARAEVNKDNPNIATIVSTGQGSVLQFKKDQYVEVVSNEAELNGVSEDLKLITKIEQNRLTLDPGFPFGEENTSVLLRLWDGKGDIPHKSEEWLSLGKSGIQIQFSDGTYRNDDYWLIPARIATQEVEWSPYQNPNTDPLPQLPHGIQHHYNRLAHVCWYKTRSGTPLRSIQDCRRRFASLHDIVEVNAIHIMHISWYNDDTLSPSDIKRNGLRLQITLDAEPDQQYASAMARDALVVTLEAPISGGDEGIFILNGDCEIRGNTISWHWNRTEKEGAVARIFKDIDWPVNRILGNPMHFIRVRVRLKGHAIWCYVNGYPVYLDGQAFGVPGGYHGGRPRIHLQFPSGAGAQASDFESWFYIRE
jgi:Family of unknown function (DUF6519)